MMKIALLGAESTGKTQLARELANHFSSQGQRALWIPEVLREWCEREGRTPRMDEQPAIAHEQARRMQQAGAVDWLLADTTPLMTAVYSELLFDDRSLYDFALEHQRGYDFTLLMGLDLPWVADGLQRDGPHVREPVDRLLRAALTTGRIGFETVQGSGAMRLQSALRVITQHTSSVQR